MYDLSITYSRGYIEPTDPNAVRFSWKYFHCFRRWNVRTDGQTWSSRHEFIWCICCKKHIKWLANKLTPNGIRTRDSRTLL